MTYCMGIDIGSTAGKGVIMRDNDVVASSILVSGINYAAASRQLLDELLDTSGLAFSEIDYTIATGTGANLVSFANDKASDVRCCARGITGIFPDVKMVIDIQAQFMRVIRVSSSGLVISSVNSEKCAAASGGLLEVIANVLQIDIQEMGPLSLKSKHPVAFTTSCAVFGETEAVSRIAEGALPEDILAGIHKSLALKVAALVRKTGIEKVIAVAGGGALNCGLIASIEKELGAALLVPPQPRMINALGAAIIAAEMYKKLKG